ncbi:FAD-dependent oxidoreductase [Spongiactinospora sp. TRM90649]|nr:FAD-dependent oxidoreductase [Spongiactinospora sp. TRM90649]MDF5753727.1 FAD-dependent oxidoreductase [Spongiactinospora sp. TRM90649]
MSVRDLVVIGGGPAGVAAAAAASRAGLSVTLIDGGPRLGGQYFRHPPGAPGAPSALRRFPRMEREVRSRAEVLTGHQVWAVERRDGELAAHCLAGDREERPVTVAARRLLIAAGAQALLKGERVVAGRRVVVAGTGPFLLPVASDLAATDAATAAAALPMARAVDVLAVTAAGPGDVGRRRRSGPDRVLHHRQNPVVPR